MESQEGEQCKEGSAGEQGYLRILRNRLHNILFIKPLGIEDSPHLDQADITECLRSIGGKWDVEPLRTSGGRVGVFLFDIGGWDTVGDDCCGDGGGGGGGGMEPGDGAGG